jgi:ABC-type phosphate/phosphonate transport system ATPase subunit
MYITIVVAIVLILGVLKFTKSKGKPRNTIAIVGERFSGKTQLFISLN